MKCPVCKQEMKKVRWEITNNLQTGKNFKEYDKFTYQCKDDDTWVTTEIPVAKKLRKSPQNSSDFADNVQ